MANARRWFLVGLWALSSGCAAHEHPRVTMMRTDADWRPLAPGTQAPPLALVQADGSPWSLSDHRGRPMVVAFYRGGW